MKRGSNNNPVTRLETSSKSKGVAVVSVAALVTTGLFLTMTGLVANDKEPTIKNPDIINIDMTFEARNDPPVKKPIEVEKPPEIIEVPEHPIDPTPKQPGSELHIWPIPPQTPLGPDPDTGFNLSQSDGEMIILAGFAPHYPRRQAEKGVEGYVLVSLTVNAEGKVEDSYVLASEPEGAFNKAALDAIAKFKYKPRITNGVPSAVYNVRYKMIFELED